MFLILNSDWKCNRLLTESPDKPTKDMQRLLMGNECIALGAIHAGVKCVCGYPGTPSTEILETVVKENPGDIYVEWSVNEKAAIEVSA